MRIIFLMLFISIVPFYGNSQCSWDEEICISGCSDTFIGSGSVRTCFNPNSTSSLNPVEIDYCYSSQEELFFDYTSPWGDLYTVKRQSIFMLCVPDDICEASLEIFSVVINQETGDEVSSTLVQSLDRVNPEDNRPTFCMDCPSGKKIDLLTHRDILKTIGTYKMCIDYKCCDGDGDIDDNNVIGDKSNCFYYEFVNAASDIDVEIAFLASQQIENINGDTDIDGIVNTDGSFPGPELGPASAGVRVSAVGNGIIDYTVEVYEVDCNDVSSESLVHSETIPYDGEDQVFYSFLNIPNWENIFDPSACYKVVTRVNSICGEYTEEAFFTITDQCTFCLTAPGSGPLTASSLDIVNSYINGGGEIVVDSEVDLHSIIILDEYGRIVKREDNINMKSLNSYQLSSNNTRYFLVVVIDSKGNVHKSMIPNVR